MTTKAVKRRFFKKPDFRADLGGKPSDWAVYDWNEVPERDEDLESWPIAVFRNKSDADLFCKLKNGSST